MKRAWIAGAICVAVVVGVLVATAPKAIVALLSSKERGGEGASMEPGARAGEHVERAAQASGEVKQATPARAPQARADRTGEEIIREMRERYDGRWPKTVTFVQKSTFYEPANSRMIQTWYEAIEAPGKLRIDIYPFERGNGMVFRNDSLYQFKRDSLVRKEHHPHALMVLSRDVYFLPAAKTIARLKQFGFDLSKAREDSWQERPVYVVGAGGDDLSSPQFWIDKENLYLVRLIQPLPDDPGSIQEVQFNRYQRLGGGWIETEVVFLIDGKRQMLEEYSDIRHGVSFEAKLFDPSRWARPGWTNA